MKNLFIILFLLPLMSFSEILKTYDLAEEFEAMAYNVEKASEILKTCLEGVAYSQTEYHLRACYQRYVSHSFFDICTQGESYRAFLNLKGDKSLYSKVTKAHYKLLKVKKEYQSLKTGEAMKKVHEMVFSGQNVKRSDSVSRIAKASERLITPELGRDARFLTYRVAVGVDPCAMPSRSKEIPFSSPFKIFDLGEDILSMEDHLSKANENLQVCLKGSLEEKDLEVKSKQAETCYKEHLYQSFSGICEQDWHYKNYLKTNTSPSKDVSLAHENLIKVKKESQGVRVTQALEEIYASVFEDPFVSSKQDFLKICER